MVSAPRRLSVVSPPTELNALPGYTLLAAMDTLTGTPTLTAGSPAYGLGHSNWAVNATNKALWNPSDGDFGGNPSINLGFAPARGLEAASVNLGSNAKISTLLVYKGIAEIYATNNYGALFEIPSGVGGSQQATNYHWSGSGTPSNNTEAWHGSALATQLRETGSAWTVNRAILTTFERDLTTNEVNMWINGVQVTVRPTNTNTTGVFGTYNIALGARTPLGTPVIPAGIKVMGFYIWAGNVSPLLNSHIKPWLDWHVGSSW